MLAEGCWGNLTGAAIREFDLGDDREPQVWELGVKEVWKVPKPLDRLIHTIGPWPVKLSAKYGQIGGTWIYPMKDEKTATTWSRSASSSTSSTRTPRPRPTTCCSSSRRIRSSGRSSRAASASRWGAKALPGGGYWSMPKLHDARRAARAATPAGMVDTVALKGVHHCIQSGMLAAEAIYEALKAGGTDLSVLRGGDRGVLDRPGALQVRNTRQPFQKGFIRGGAARQPGDRHQGPVPGRALAWHRNDEKPMFVGDTPRTLSQAGRQVHVRQALVGLHHRQRDARRRAQPHPRAEARAARGRRDVGVDVPGRRLRDPRRRARGGPVDLIVNYTNCVQCGAITAKGGRLTTPEGGDGPLYQIT